MHSDTLFGSNSAQRFFQETQVSNDYSIVPSDIRYLYAFIGIVSNLEFEIPNE